MPDPINGMSNSSPIAPTNAGGQTAAPATTGTPNAAVAAAVTPTDQAAVGHTEALLQSIVQAASNAPGIDQAKVDELRQAIASGSYQVNSQMIAQKLAELENLLGTAGLVR